MIFLDSNVLSKVLEGHTDAVWQLVISGQKLLSCSADGSVRLWDPTLTEPLQSTFNRNSFFFICFVFLLEKMFR
jgi:striatin 1/3/4